MKREIFVGSVGIGGSHPVSIQSMTAVPTGDVRATLDQIETLKDEECDIIRVAVPDRDSLPAFAKIITKSPLPVVADIHFDAYLALRAIESGAAGIRINPGNIGSKKKLKEILNLANQVNIPIRIGVNSGSIEKKYWREKGTKAEIMVRSVMDSVRFFEDSGFFNIKISLKSSNVRETVTAYRLIDQACDYPLHLGITEAGTFFSGTVKSAVGLGSLLMDGIGSTIRVSLTEDPVKEVRVAREILKATGHRVKGIEIISCPTCARTSVDLIPIVKEVEKRITGFKTDKRIVAAIMGCEVNGPGEAREADIGLAFSRSRGFIFKKGEMVEKIAPRDAVPRLIELIKDLL